MKKTVLVGLIAGVTGLAVGYKVAKDKNNGFCIDFWNDHQYGSSSKILWGSSISCY